MGEHCIKYFRQGKFTFLFPLFLIFSPFFGKAQTTSIPDNNFEQALIDLGIDSDGTINGQVLTADIATVTDLIIPDWYGISNLTGIEDFAGLEKLDISGSSLNHIDLTSNPNLKILYCNDVQGLSSIDLSGNPLLEELWCSNLQNDVPLVFLTEIDLSNNPHIEMIVARNLPLQMIDLKSGNNNMTMPLFIEISHDAGPRPSEQTNNGVCIQVDMETVANQGYYPYHTWQIIGPYFYSENCALNTPEVLQKEITIFPNPVGDFIQVQGMQPQKLEIYSPQGKRIKSLSKNLGRIDMRGLSPGIYFLKLYGNEAIAVKKIVKK